MLGVQVPSRLPLNIFNMDETITISKEEYEELLEDAKFMRALEAAGVDNWEGYEYAQDLLGK